MFKETQPMLYLADIKHTHPPRDSRCGTVLKRNGLPPRILAVFRRLHGETSYSVRLRSGDSGVYTLKRGLREGCASSCTLYNVFHNCALEELNRVTLGIRLRCSPSLHCNGRARGGRRDAPLAEETLRCLHTLGFADDTTTIFPAPKLASVREQVTKVLGDRGETVHPGKDEFMTTGMYRPNETLAAGHQHHVRMLGAWIDTDGSIRMDTSIRIRAAAKVWSKLRKPLTNSGLPLKEQGHVFLSAALGSLLYASEVRVWLREDLTRIQKFANRCIRYIVYAKRRVGFRQMRRKHCRMTNLYDWTGVEMLEVYITRRTLRYLSSLAKYDDDRWEVQMLGADFEARREDKRGGSKLTLRQRYWNVIQKVMEHTGVPAEAWYSEWREVARDKETWKKASEITVEVVTLETTARCEEAGLDRPAEEITNLALKAGGRGTMGLDMRVCPKCGDTLHPLGFTHHVKKCNGTRRKYNILMRSKVCSVCGISMNRESIPRHEATRRARRGALNPATPVRRRITGKRAPGHVEVACRAEPMAAKAKRRKQRGDTMVKSDTVRREKKRAAPDGRSFECKYCGNSFSAEKHAYSCEEAPWTEWAKGVR